jgi:hypothetical protein
MSNSAVRLYWLVCFAVAALLPGYGWSAETAAEPADPDEIAAMSTAEPGPVLFDPVGGWLLEYKVKFTGPYLGTAADALDQPLRRLMDGARQWAAQQGLGVHWYSGYYPGPGTFPTLDMAEDPRALGIAMIHLAQDYSAFHTGSGPFTVPRLRPEETTYETRLGIALPEGTAAQRDSLNILLTQVQGVTLVGGWPLATYIAARYPEWMQSRTVLINGQAYQWPTDFTLDEQRRLRADMAMANAKLAGQPWGGDIYKIDSPISAMSRFGLGPLARFRYVAGTVTVENVPPLADMSQLQTVSWQPSLSLMVDPDEVDLPFNAAELLIESSRRDYENDLRPYQPNGNSHCYRAAVALDASSESAPQAEALDKLVTQWAAQYPELATTKVLTTGLVEGGDHPQWQVTLALDSRELGSSLAGWLQARGMALETFSLILPLAGNPAVPLEPQGQSHGYWNSPQDRAWAWQLEYELAPKDPHGYDAELMAERLGKERVAELRTLLDNMRSKYETWLKQQQLTEAPLDQLLMYHFYGGEDEMGVVQRITVHARSRDEAASLKALLATPGLPQPAISERRFYDQQPYPSGMSLAWTLVLAEKLRGVLPSEVEAKLPQPLRAKATADGAALKAAFESWVAQHPNSTAQPPKLSLMEFGGLPRRVWVATPFAPGSDLDSLEAALRAALPGLPPAKREKPYNYAFEPQKSQDIYNDYERELLAFQLVPWERIAGLSNDELAAALSAAELAAIERKRQAVTSVVAEWNATQVEADRVTLGSSPPNEIPPRLRLLGGNRQTALVKSLMAKLELAGLTNYSYGFGFMQRNRQDYYAGHPGGQRVPVTRLYYKLIPNVYTNTGPYDELPQRLARYYTPQQLAEINAVADATERAVAAWASENGLSVRTQHQGFEVADSVRLNRVTRQGSVATALQATVAVADDARRAELAASLEAYLKTHVPGLPDRDTSGTYLT